MGGNNGLLFMDEFFTERLDALSENDLDDTGEQGSGDPVEHPSEEGETTGGNEQEPGGDSEDQGKEDKEDASGSDPAEPEQPAPEKDSVEGSLSKKDVQELLDRISERFDQKDGDVAELTESIRSLVDLMRVEPYSTPGYVYEPPEIPIEGYKEWNYPIIVDYMITIVGYGEPIPQSNDYDDHDQFLEDFQAFAFECYKGDVYSEFYIDKVWGADGKKLYDSQGMEEPEPDPGEEETNETAEMLLSHLEDINTTLLEMQQADLEYYQSVTAYQEEMLKLQTADTGATIILCIAVFAVLGELAIKHLLEVFR